MKPIMDPEEYKKLYGKLPSEMAAERSKRFQDVYAMKEPDRIPITLNLGYMLARLGGVSFADLEAKPEVQQELLEEWALYYQADDISGGGWPGFPSRMLGDRQTRWPGYELAADRPFQFVESEVMKAEDYDEFIYDPSDFCLRHYLPTVFKELEPLATLPPLSIFLNGYSYLMQLAYFGAPPIMGMFQKIAELINTFAAGGPAMMQNMQRMQAIGYNPGGMGIFGFAPFDFLGDTLRGTRGIMRDIRQRPDKLLAAMDSCRKIMLDNALAIRSLSGGMANMVMIPLHKGSDGFISIEQFETFYWPSFKGMMMDLIDNGFTPMPFYEGVWDQRLEYLAQFPRGKTRGMFERSNMFKVKEVLGDVMPIIGGFPVSVLQGGTAEQVRDLTKEYCQVMGKGGGYVMGAGTAMDYCDKDLVKVWVDATKEFGAG